MASKKSKPQTKRAMPRTSNPSPTSRNRRKQISSRVSAAVCMPEDLYGKVISDRLPSHDNNFSGYVRELIRADLGRTA